MAAYWRATCAVLLAADLARAAAGEPSCGPDEVCGPRDVEAAEEASVDALRVELLQSRGKLVPASSPPTQENHEADFDLMESVRPRYNVDVWKLGRPHVEQQIAPARARSASPNGAAPPPPASRRSAIESPSSPRCTARSMAELEACLARLPSGRISRILVAGHIQCSSSSSPCLDLRGRVAPLWLEGASSGAGLYRASYSQPLLSISGSERLYVHGLTFEDALWPSCFPRLAPPGPSKPMISITRAAAVVFANCTFLRGFKIGVAISASHHIAFSHNIWLESQCFGVWVDNVHKYSYHVHFFGNQFLHGRNNAFIGTLSNSSFQGNDFVHNHHIACFNQSGGQLDIIQKAGPNTNLAIAANRIVDGSITGGDSGQNWHSLSTQAFEIHSGTHVFLLHNDAYNNSGWSTKPNPKNWPGGANITLEANRMCSRCGHVRGLTHTVCTGKEHPSPHGWQRDWCNATDAPWVHRVGEQECEANSNEHGICGDSNCNEPVRPRGGLQAGTATSGGTPLSWWVADVDSLSVRLLRNFSLSAVPEPMAVPDAQRGKYSHGSEILHDVSSIADGGELVALWAEGYGVLDVTLVASQDTLKSVF